MTEARDAIISRDERHHRACAGALDRHPRAPRDFLLVEARNEGAARLAHRDAHIPSEGTIPLHFFIGEQRSFCGNLGFEGSAADQRPIAGNVAPVADDIPGCPNGRGGIRVLRRPTVLEWFEPEPRQRFFLQARHLDVVGDNVAISSGGDQETAVPVLTAAVNSIGSPAGQPGKIRLGVDEDAARPFAVREASQTVGLFVEFAHARHIVTFPARQRKHNLLLCRTRARRGAASTGMFRLNREPRESPV